MKANTKFNLGMVICYFGSIGIIALIGLAGLPASIANMAYAVLGGIGVFILRSAYNAGAEIIQGREYKLINIQEVTCLDGEEVVFVTFIYKNAYGNERVCTFENLEFKQEIKNCISERFVGYKQEGSKKLIMTKL
jgi:hypothetical protein